ncbi:MAG: tripartite tricarboxylate transporter substrate binding protein [Burkholderiales bacterium]|nr:tripartite tricarboxylate transporter substrate binding protein [Burkholderiales bacterium]
MRWGTTIAVVCGILTVASAAAHAAETSYPTRPIRIIVPYPPGGSTDPTARNLGQWLSEKFGQSVVIDNRPGAGATLGHALGAQATPDGYNLLLGTSGGLVTGPAFGTKVPYDPVKDYTPIGLAVDVPFLLIVHPSIAATTVKELIDLSKAQPGKITFGSPGMGTPNHLGMELLKSMGKAEFVHVPYKGGGPALVDLMAGRIHALFGGIPYAAPALKSGKAKLLAVGHPERTKFYPDTPSVAELLPGFTNTTWYGLLGPVGVPKPIVAKINAEMKVALANAEFRKQLEALGLDPVYSTPEELRERIRGELARWTKVIKEAGIGAGA